MSVKNFNVTVEIPRKGLFHIGIEPVPIMKWHDVTNAREDLRNVIRATAGHIDRRTAILQGTLEVIKVWGAKGIIFPDNWMDGDEYIPLLKMQ